MVNFYWTDKEDVITGEIAQEGFDYSSEETEAESSSLAIHQVMDYLVEQIYDNCQYAEYTVEQTEDEIYIRDLDGKILEYYYGFFVDSLIEKAMDDAGQSVIFCGQFNTCHPFSLPAPAFRFRSLNLSYPFPTLWTILRY